LIARDHFDSATVLVTTLIVSPFPVDQHSVLIAHDHFDSATVLVTTLIAHHFSPFPVDHHSVIDCA
jgi:hypothetical protein